VLQEIFVKLARQPDLLRAAQANEGLAPGFIGTEAGANTVLRVHGDVGVELSGDVVGGVDAE